MAAGEVSPSFFGHVDNQSYALGLSTCRNAFISYRGGAYSRAGTKFVGYSAQTTHSFPPRLITFRFSIKQGLILEFGHLYMRVIQNGGFVTESAQSVSVITQGSPVSVQTSSSHGYATGDWVYLSGIAGMPALEAQTFYAVVTGPTTFSLSTPFGAPIDSTNFGAYTGGGTAARIYTLVTPWAEKDLKWLKFDQSADVMSICCWNQDDGTLYQPQELARISNNSWTLTPANFVSTVSPPASAPSLTLTHPAGALGTADNSAATYAFGITAVNPNDGSESVMTDPGIVGGSANLAVTSGSILLTWPAVSGVQQYNIYAAEPIAGTTAATPPSTMPAGVLYGYVGTALQTSFTYGNIVPDFSQVPPTHYNPFSGTGNDPSVVTYFQERRVYMATPNQPDTYFMSQPGSFLNFDRRIPTIDSDSITGTPWAQKVDGIQFAVAMPGGLVVLTGSSAWQLTGVGGSSLNPQPITPANQQAQPQAYNGCHSHIPPDKVNWEVFYVQAKGSLVRAFAYNYFINIYTGIDLTYLSSHLFLAAGQANADGSIREWAWSEEPYKVRWVVREDGTLLSLTYLKEQEVAGWARHDTFGQFVSVASCTELPVDATYFATSRPSGLGTAYLIERMDNRLWESVLDCWCVDAGLALPQGSGPVTRVTGLNHLLGNYVAAIMDGVPIVGLLVQQFGDGTIGVTLPFPASNVKVGIGYTVQVQSLYLDAGQPTIQARRKKIAKAAVRLEASAGVQIGCNQPDASTQSPPASFVEWSNLTSVPDRGVPFTSPGGGQGVNLWTGDSQPLPLTGGYQVPGQVCAQQLNPLPMQILAFIPEILPGDIPETDAKEPPPQRQQPTRPQVRAA